MAHYFLYRALLLNRALRALVKSSELENRVPIGINPFLCGETTDVCKSAYSLDDKSYRRHKHRHSWWREPIVIRNEGESGGKVAYIVSSHNQTHPGF